MDSHRLEVLASEDTPSNVNENLADQIQKEWKFKFKRALEAIVIRFGIVMIILAFLETLLIISNNFHHLGYWELFIMKSSQCRDALNHTRIGRAAHLDSALLDPYSLWRGWVVPSVLAGSTYVVVSLLSLRHELYHWKPELLAHYFETSKASKIGQHIPPNWIKFAYHIYEDKHRKHVGKHLQKRTHVALEDSNEFLKVLRTVAFNILISSITLLVFWVFLLQPKIESDNIVQLPKSYVPPIQGILWYLCNDFFYFYPHSIAHHGPSTDAFYSKFLPLPVAKALHTHFKQSHKLHHRTKANLGIAAWYCSPWEQILFNIFPVLIGPYLTQVLADAFHLEQIWGTHLMTLYIWLMAASAMSVLAHTGFRSCLNDPGKHDLHHERAFDPKTAVNFGTLGVFDWLHGTRSSIPETDARAWREQRSRQAALYEASRRTGVALTKEQMEVVKQPDHSEEWVDKTI
jgi:sterol desaturase/sphingolipid hydroxylase (fatty acid hydroxylase superfamily)